MHAEAPAPKLHVDGMAAHALMPMHTDCSADWDRLKQWPGTALADSRVITVAELSTGHRIPADAHALLPMWLAPTCPLQSKKKEGA